MPRNELIGVTDLIKLHKLESIVISLSGSAGVTETGQLSIII